jgi:hypothetical protein
MPAMPRIRGKATRVAYKIMGTPPNIAHKRSKMEKKINKQLIYEETDRAR